MIRAMERYAVDLDQNDLDNICNDIINEEYKYSKLLVIQKNKREAYFVKYDKKEFIIIFSRGGKIIVTFLHKNWVQKNEDGSYKIIFKQGNKKRKEKPKKNEKKQAKGSGRSKKSSKGFRYSKMKQEIPDLEF